MKVIQQDMLAIKRGIIFHQVNCQGVMGGGIAYALAKRFPRLEKAYQEFCRNNYKGIYTSSLLGQVFLFKVRDDLFVANVFGQDDISSRSRQTSYDATAEAFESIVNDREFPSGLPLYFPFKMGCGLGGGNWTIYSAIIAEYFPNAIICQHNV